MVVSSIVSASLKSNASFGWKCCGTFLPTYGLVRMFDISILLSFEPAGKLLCTNKSERPISSSMVRIPSFAMYSRISCAMNRIKLMMYSGLPLNRFRNSGFCVATPAGQVSKLQTRIMTQPIVTSGAVAKPYSSAPSIAAMMTSRPVIILPSVSMTTLERRPFIIKVWWVSAKPSSHGNPALWMELLGAAPVPPS